MKKSLVFAASAAIDLVVAVVFLYSGYTVVSVLLLASAVVVGLMAFLQWRRGQ